jgi:hypothetical protein
MSAKKSPSWDKAPRKARADSKLKNLPETDQETIWLLMHPTDATVTPWTLEAVLVHLQEEHEVSCALSTLSEWHSWYALKRRMEAAGERAEQAKLELAKDKSFSAEDLERVAQAIFTAETLEAGNAKAYVQIAKLALQRRALDLDARRVAVLEAKAAKADQATSVANDEALSEEEKATRLKQLFRMG